MDIGLALGSKARASGSMADSAGWLTLRVSEAMLCGCRWDCVL